MILSENPLRCTTQDEKGLVLTIALFYLIFDPIKNNEFKRCQKFQKDYILDYSNFRFHLP
jgi:hypothetical protein